MLQHLLSAADWGSSFAPQFKLRALRALKHIFRGLTTKRFVAEPVPVQGSSVMGAWVLGGGAGELARKIDSLSRAAQAQFKSVLYNSLQLAAYLHCTAPPD